MNNISIALITDPWWKQS